MAGPLLPTFQSANGDELRELAAELARDLGRLRPREPVPWPLALAFNDLLESTRATTADDPVVAGMGRLSAEAETATATVIGLLGQLDIALGAAT